MTVKYIDTYSKNWSVAVTGVLSFAYCIFILPFHIPLAVYSTINYQDMMGTRFLSDKIITLLSLSVPIALLLIGYLNRPGFRRHFFAS